MHLLDDRARLPQYVGQEPRLVAGQIPRDKTTRAEFREPIHHLNLVWNFTPEENGVRLELAAQTNQAIDGSFLVQQCLRFTGSLNQQWRTEIARVPFLSELDMHAMGRPNATLTFGRRHDACSQFPVQHVRLPTTGRRDATGQRIASALDHGLVVRESPRRSEAPSWYWDRVAPGTTWEQIAAGFYWERTAAVSNRHPADCVHAWVDVGPLAAGETRRVCGNSITLPARRTISLHFGSRTSSKGE